MAMRFMKKAVPETVTGKRAAPHNTCLIHSLPVNSNEVGIIWKVPITDEGVCIVYTDLQSVNTRQHQSIH